MSELDINALESSLAAIKDPRTGGDLSDTATISVKSPKDGAVEAEIILGYPAAGHSAKISDEAKKILLGRPGVESAEVKVGWNVIAHTAQQNLKGMENVRNIIAVASGKGGVGKSTTAVNLALALKAEGAKAGMLDADIYGPSLPSMLGIEGNPESPDGKRLEPMEGLGLQAMSIGFLIDKDTPMVWRGPMVTQALEQLLTETNWRDLDYLVIDLPPGTGDVQLTLAQKIPVNGAVIVTTPQDIALLDASKGVKMFQKVDVPILGIVENMSLHICSKCGHEEPIFGSGGGAKMAGEYDVDLLGCLPIDVSIREQTDAGNPPVFADPDGHVAAIYRDIAVKASSKLAIQKRDFSAKFPKIVVQQK